MLYGPYKNGPKRISACLRYLQYIELIWAAILDPPHLVQAQPTWQHGNIRRQKNKHKALKTLTGIIVESLVSERVQLLQDLVHGLLFVLQLLELGEFDAGSGRPSI